MKRSQLTIQTYIIDDSYDLGDIRIFWSDQDSRWWQWKYSPDGEISGTWYWLPWVWPPVQMWDPKDIEPHPSNDQWCMVLVKTSYGSADDAILNPMNLIKQPYVVLYGGWELKAGTSEPETPWFDNVESIPPEPKNWLDTGMSGGSGVGIFAQKNVTRMNPITHEKENWILPPSAPRKISWDTTNWKEPDDPYDDNSMDYEMLKRRGWYKKDPPEHIPAGWAPKKIDFGGSPRPKPTPPPKPPTIPPSAVAPRRKT
jgi:hypothetical protein